ncbi:MAG: ATP synthase F1 subunit epsilon [bacterium]
MSKTFHFILSTPEAVLFDGKTDYVGATTPEGEIGIMADHLPVITLISSGVMKISSPEGEKILATGSGFIKVTKDKVMGFTQTAEFAESIDEERAISAMKEAQNKMKEKTDEMTLADATGLLERNAARLKVVERKKKRSRR